MTLITRIRKHERGLHFRHGDFRGTLQPGRYIFWSRLWSSRRDTVEVFDTLATQLCHKLLDTIVEHPDARAELMVVELNDTERAIVWRADRLFAILGPGRHAFWWKPH